MIRLSANSTLFFKVFLPVFFIVFYGLFSVFLFMDEVSPIGKQSWVPYSNLVFYLSIVFIFYKTVWPLVRVECGPDGFVVTNYRQTYKYTYDSIKTFGIARLFIWKIGLIEFHSKSKFGAHISFIIDQRKLDQIREEFGEIVGPLAPKA